MLVDLSDQGFEAVSEEEAQGVLMKRSGKTWFAVYRLVMLYEREEYTLEGLMRKIDRLLFGLGAFPLSPLLIVNASKSSGMSFSNLLEVF